jgi:hypothetical protein
LLHTKEGGPGKETGNRNEGFNLVRFAHNWNNGMLELWNDGLKKTNRKAQIIALLLLF